MPINIGKFSSEGEEPKREFIQENILRILRANPDNAFSSIELEDMLDTRRQSINQALRALDSKGLIDRKFVEENKRNVCYAKLRKEETNEEVPVAKPKKKKGKGKGRKKSARKSSKG